MNQYTALKAAWHLDKIATLRMREQIVPAQIQLIISDLCNHDCGFCAYRMSGYPSNANFAENGNNNPNRMIPVEKCLEILEDARQMGVQAIQFTGGGEPTVHPDHMRIFEFALHLGFDCALVTNGNILRDGWQDIYPRFKWLRVSLDAGTPDTYAKIRRVKDQFFERALGNIWELSQEIERRPGCHLGVSFVVTAQNYGEVMAATRCAAVNGAHSIRFAPVFTPKDDKYYPEWMLRRVGDSISLARRSHPRLKVIDQLSNGRLADLKQHSPEYSNCAYQQFNVYIGGDLNIYRCCNTAYNDRGYIGSLKEQRLRDFWQSDEKRRAYAQFDARGCERCAFNDKNRMINYLIEKEPLHVGFV